jgi:hypothetical protein
LSCRAGGTPPYHCPSHPAIPLPITPITSRRFVCAMRQHTNCSALDTRAIVPYLSIYHHYTCVGQHIPSGACGGPLLLISPSRWRAAPCPPGVRAGEGSPPVAVEEEYSPSRRTTQETLSLPAAGAVQSSSPFADEHCRGHAHHSFCWDVSEGTRLSLVAARPLHAPAVGIGWVCVSMGRFRNNGESQYRANQNIGSGQHPK